MKKAEKDKLDREFAAMCAKHAAAPKFAGKFKVLGTTTGRILSDPRPAPQSIALVPRPMTYTPHGGTAKPEQKYTGGNMLGVATMHKSNSVPVFSQQEAVDISKMRRG